MDPITTTNASEIDTARQPAIDTTSCHRSEFFTFVPPYVVQPSVDDAVPASASPDLYRRRREKTIQLPLRRRKRCLAIAHSQRFLPVMNKSIPKTMLRPGMAGTHSRAGLIALHAGVRIVAEIEPLPGLRIADRGSLETEL